MSTKPQFNTDVEAQHDRFEISSDRGVYIIGDVHGSRVALEVLLAELNLDDDDFVFLVGDLVRKGPDSPGVIDLVREDSRLVSVRGNNEQKIVRGDKNPDWLRNGDLDYLNSLPVAISFDDILVVHGGIDPQRQLKHHTVDELLTMRAPHGNGYDGPFWYDDYDGPYRVFFGHTVHDHPVNREYAVCLDTGCVYGGTLTAYDYRNDEFITVEGKTHQERATSKVVDPA
ncbi:metallophosphoesterase family protein [Halosegnis rubeus]|jgi:serine/threonine protein phosphatase 1|uniref:Serine/threonine protein phosphatase n=1 Tax=Halosegnis rubeus TaxID=2212850 RepID=A0A5N5ULN0_9EURY|nr:metallophosphoesterase family protein [Halosegnis rubeus]KAB7518263.1 serine/threonine protein phosphatase [Halosegnis rubeus]